MLMACAPVRLPSPVAAAPGGSKGHGDAGARTLTGTPLLFMIEIAVCHPSSGCRDGRAGVSGVRERVRWRLRAAYGRDLAGLARIVR